MTNNSSNSNNNRVLLSFLLFLLFSTPLYAQKLESVIDDWNVLSTTIESKSVCYIASLPVSQEGNFTEPNNSYFLVSIFPDRAPEISYSPGFNIKLGTAAEIDIDGKKIKLSKIKDQVAWANSTELDVEIIEEMKSGIKMVVMAPSNNGNYAIDIFSLKGFSKSFKEIQDSCKVEEE